MTAEAPTLLPFRILIMGTPAAGKSWLARRIGSHFEIPCLELDSAYFTSNWTPKLAEDWRAVVDQVLSTERWIIDGNHVDSARSRMSRAQLLVVYDRHPLLCLMSYWLRIMRLMVVQVDEVPDYAKTADGRRRPAHMPLRFSGSIVRFRSRVVPKILELASKEDLAVLVIRNRRQAQALTSNSFFSEP